MSTAGSYNIEHLNCRGKVWDVLKWVLFVAGWLHGW